MPSKRVASYLCSIQHVDTDAEASNKSAFLSFSGDAEDDEPVDLFGQASKATAEDDEDDDENEDEGDDGEPEDDFNAAWEVLDLARALYEKQQDESDEIKLKLAETYVCLGDVSLETGEFSITCPPCTSPDVAQRNLTRPFRTTRLA